MSNLDKAKVSVKKILDCNTLIECQSVTKQILTEIGFHDQPKDLVDNDAVSYTHLTLPTKRIV